MAESEKKSTDDGIIVINLKDRWWAAFLAWLIPGMGHMYQGRYGKGILFFICIMGSFMYGTFLGEGRVVYAAWEPDNYRWPYIFQVAAGAPALPAIIQSYRFKAHQGNIPDDKAHGSVRRYLSREFMVPPNMTKSEGGLDELDLLNKRLHRYFEMGTLYTVVAGLLNILVVFDAFGGPAFLLQVKDDGQGRKPTGKKNTPPTA